MRAHPAHLVRPAYLVRPGQIVCPRTNRSVAVLLPGAFYALRETKLPPIEALRRHKVPIAIASDCNPGTSPARSLLAMLSMAATLFRLTPEKK